MSSFVPLSVRDGNRRKRFGWWLKGQREALALRLAPWLRHARERILVEAQTEANAEAYREAKQEYRAIQGSIHRRSWPPR